MKTQVRCEAECKARLLDKDQQELAVKKGDMIAFVPSICPSIDHSQFVLIQTLAKTPAKPDKTHSLTIL